jgi:hypothetical protein
MKDERLAELAMLSQGLSAAWPTLSQWLIERKDRFTQDLVNSDNAETRGRIKELAEILELPERLRNEAIALQQPQQEEGDLP